MEGAATQVNKIVAKYELRDVDAVKAGTYSKQNLDTATRLELYLHCAGLTNADADHLTAIINATPASLQELYINLE